MNKQDVVAQKRSRSIYQKLLCQDNALVPSLSFTGKAYCYLGSRHDTIK